MVRIGFLWDGRENTRGGVGRLNRGLEYKFKCNHVVIFCNIRCHFMSAKHNTKSKYDECINLYKILGIFLYIINEK